jgi:acyl-CoA ligase (AMP-forming) (exosortase A-associated)
MPTLLHQILTNSPSDKTALIHKKQRWTYQQLNQLVQQQATALKGIHLQKNQRVAIYLPKQLETVTSFLSTSLAGGVFVPINPVLKAPQVQHILNDCNVQILITSKNRLQALKTSLASCSGLQTIILVENETPIPNSNLNQHIIGWDEFIEGKTGHPEEVSSIDTNMAAILYTSGSTGKPKGVVLSHRNLIAGAKSVSEYLAISADDHLLAVLPFSFDYGLNQLISSLLKGATCTLLDYLLPRDVIRTVEKNKITGLAAVPPLWVQLADLEWPESIGKHLRYMTNSGGKMPRSTLETLQSKLPNMQFFPMYGLTEAFRSTYLPPDQINKRPDSIGKAIPNAEVMVVREDGSPCAPHEPGELVHKGSLVALGYWNDATKTAERFKAAPGHIAGLPLQEIAVWSGDTVTIDEEGYLYFIGRKDDMIKTSGYRVSPTEVEEVIYASGLVKEVAALGISHPQLGQAIVLAVSPLSDSTIDEIALINCCKKELPNFMTPASVHALEKLPKNPNGKIDRPALTKQFSTLFAAE